MNSTRRLRAAYKASNYIQVGVGKESNRIDKDSNKFKYRFFWGEANETPRINSDESNNFQSWVRLNQLRAYSTMTIDLYLRKYKPYKQ